MLNNTNYYIPKGSWDLGVLTNKIADIRKDFSDVFVVADFDRTLTTGDSFTVWSFLARSWIVGEDYTRRRDELFAYYRPFEVNNEISSEEKNHLMAEWWSKHLSLLIEYGVKRTQIDEVVGQYMNWRKWVLEFFEITNKLNIPIIIVSAWIGNFIEEFFGLHRIDISSISIESNFLIYNEDWVISWMNKEYMIHTFNKNNHILNDFSKSLVWNRKQALVLWDSNWDLRMIDLFDVDNYLSIWLLTNETNKEYFDNSWFDIINLDEDFNLINSLFSL